MPTPIKRESLVNNIEKLYETRRVGGAYDAKTAGKTFVDFFTNHVNNHAFHHWLYDSFYPII